MGTYVTLPGDLSDYDSDLILSGSTEPTTTQADNHLDLLEAEFELAAKSRGYTVPVTSGDSPNSFKLAGLYLVKAVAAYVIRNRGMILDAAGSDAETVFTEWTDFLRRVREEPNYLADAARESGSDDPDQSPTWLSNMNSSAEARARRVFKREFRV